MLILEVWNPATHVLLGDIFWRKFLSKAAESPSLRCRVEQLLIAPPLEMTTALSDHEVEARYWTSTWSHFQGKVYVIAIFFLHARRKVCRVFGVAPARTLISSSHPKNRLLKSEAIVVACAKSGAEGADDRNDKRETAIKFRWGRLKTLWSVLNSLSFFHTGFSICYEILEDIPNQAVSQFLWSI